MGGGVDLRDQTPRRGAVVGDERDAVRGLIEKINDLRDVTSVYTTLEIDGTPLALGVDVASPAGH